MKSLGSQSPKFSFWVPGKCPVVPNDSLGWSIPSFLSLFGHGTTCLRQTSMNGVSEVIGVPEMGELLTQVSMNPLCLYEICQFHQDRVWVGGWDKCCRGE